MKICPNCNTQLADDAMFCTTCGAQFASQGAGQYGAYQQPAYAPVADIYDHTNEFNQKDISDNKVFAMLGYLLGVFGIIIALLASHSSEYTMFHVRQALKFIVVNILLGIASLLLVWTLIAPAAASIMMFVLGIIKIICFFQVCSGKAKEPAIIRSLKFLK